MSRLKNKNIDQKRSRSEQSRSASIIHCTNDDTELVRPKVRESWSTLQACYHRTWYEGYMYTRAEALYDKLFCVLNEMQGGFLQSRTLGVPQEHLMAVVNR